jgi:hypothetical protein
MKTTREGRPPGRTGVSETPEADESLRRRIEERAYELFEKRGRTPGRHLEDWLEAERQVLQEIRMRPLVTTGALQRGDVGQTVASRRRPTR